MYKKAIDAPQQSAKGQLLQWPFPKRRRRRQIIAFPAQPQLHPRRCGLPRRLPISHDLPALYPKRLGAGLAEPVTQPLAQAAFPDRPRAARPLPFEQSDKDSQRAYRCPRKMSCRIAGQGLAFVPKSVRYQTSNGTRPSFANACQIGTWYWMGCVVRIANIMITRAPADSLLRLRIAPGDLRPSCHQD